MGFSSREINGISNHHIWEFLRYYLKLQSSPKYAAFIDGPWGVGKSHLVQQIVDDHFRGWKDDYVKVSLFGLSSVAEIDEALFSAIYPMLNSPGAHFVGGVMKAGLSYVSASTEIRLQKLLSNKEASVYIFDDLERCELELPKVLGYINNFVESGAKVIIIGDQSRLDISQDPSSLERYVKEREKLVGKILKVDPSFEEAWSSFIDQLKSVEARTFIEAHRDIISSTFTESDTQNLRILQIATWDFERIVPIIKPDHLQNKEAMETFTALFFAISFEVKRGRLTENDVIARDNIRSLSIRRHLTPKEKIPLSPIEISREQYKLIDICDPLLPVSLLIDLLFRGTIPVADIGMALDRSRFFAQQSEQPAWLRLIHILDLTDEEFEAAFDEMEQAFREREITNIGEVLHVFSHRLWLARNEVISSDLPTITQECIAYLDSLYESGRLPPSTFSHDRGLQFSSYAGYAFAEREQPEFQQLILHLRELLAQVELDHYPQRASNLLDEMKNDPDLFSRRIHLNNSTDNTLWNIPVLTQLSVEGFTTEILGATPAQQGTIIRALGSRYESNHIRENELKTELPWLRGVRSELLRQASQLPRLTSRRINILVSWCLDPVLLETPD